MHKPLEGPVEVADIIEAGLQSNLADLPVCFQKQLRTFADAEIIQVFKGGHVRYRSKGTAKLPFADVKGFFQFIQGNSIIIICLQVFHNGFNEPGTVIGIHISFFLIYDRM